MSYLTMSKMMTDSTLMQRISACIAEQTPGSPDQAFNLANINMSRIVAKDEWSSLYEESGHDGITDEMILERVLMFIPTIELIPPAVSTLNGLDETVAILAAEMLGGTDV